MSLAATFNVSKTADTNDGTCDADCSLREAIIAANALADADTINLPAGLYLLNLTGAGEDNAATGDLDVLNPVTIIGAGAPTTFIDGNGTDRVFELFAGVTFSSLTIQGGNPGGAEDGGGILIDSVSPLVLTDSVVTGNTAEHGGGIFSKDNTVTLTRVLVNGNNTNKDGAGVYLDSTTATLTNVTVSGNTANDDGGGVYHNGGSNSFVNVTLTDNTAVGGKGGGLRRGGGSLTTFGSIIADNTAPSDPNCDGDLVSLGYNLENTDECGLAGPGDLTNTAPQIGPLQDNGGPSWTHAPLIGSPVIEGSTNTGCPATDQRGAPRPDGPLCDIGAFEGVVYEISGRVFEDADFAGTASGYDGGAGDQALANVDVEIYTSTDTLITSIVTDGTGSYSFYGVDGDYKIRARTATLGDGNTPPRGTFNGACGITDPASGPACAIAEQTWANGAAAYGGQSATADDTATDDDAGPGDTWIPLTLSGADATGVDFGFAYNLVVNSQDGGQGSLRQFIENSNAIGAVGGTTANYSEFRLPVSDPNYNAGTGVFTLTIAAPLTVTDGGTTIDGTRQTANGGNTNPVVLGSGGTVGVGPDGVVSSGDELPLAQVAGPEIELRDSGAADVGVLVQANGTTVRGLALLGFGTTDGDGAIRVDNDFISTLIEQNVIGSPANSFTDPGSPRNYVGVHSEGGDNGTIQNNLIGFQARRGIWLISGSSNWNVLGNEIRDSGLENADGDGIAISGSGLNTATGNLITGSSSQGLVINTAGSDNNTFVNNTVTGNGVGIPSGVVQSAGVTARGSAGPMVLERNVIHANYGAGVQVNSPATSVRMTLNSFADNGTIVARDASPVTNQIGIDLNLAGDDNNFGTAPFFNLNDNGDGDSGGNDIDNFAVIEQAQIIGPNLEIRGFAASGATVEVYISDGDPSNFGEGETYLFSAVEGSPQDTDGTNGSYGPGPVNGVVQGDENPVPRFQFSVPLASLVVAPTAADELVATATVGGQTSEFSGRAPLAVGSIAGTVFVDIVGDGLADGPIGPSPNPFVSGTRVELWLDGGDNIPDGGDDSYYGFTTSAIADGSYQFAGLTSGTYWVAVDAGGVARGPYNGGYSGADAWAEQTYGPAGAATFDGVSWSFAPGAGAVYGGAEWDVSDNFPPTNSLPTAEHIARVAVNDDDTTAVDFGFSFNVVTTTRGGDGTVDPGTPPGQRSVQGSLRQFLTNANAEVGANTMRFVPAAPTNGADAGHSWWRIDVTALLPVIEDDNTSVDGQAYSSADGVTVVNPNDADLGAGETVGVDGLFTTPILDPELELEVSGIDYGIQIDNASSTAIRNLSIWKSNENDLRLGDGAGVAFTGTLIEQNVIGTPPYRFDASLQPTGNDLIDAQDDADSGTLQNNLIGFADGGGFSPELGATGWLVFQNEIRGIGRAAGWGPRQDAVGDGAPGIIIRGNLLVDSAGGAIDSYLSIGGHTIEQNTLRNNGTSAPEEFGIRIMGNSGSSIVKNIFEANNGPGILVVSDRASIPYPASNANLISQNHFLIDSAGIAIDLLDAASPDAEHETGDGIMLNDGGTDANAGNLGLDFPVIDNAGLGASLTVTGFSRPGVSIEFYKAAGAVNDQNTGGTPHGEGLQYLFTATEGSGADTDAATGSYASPDYGSDPAANRFSFTVAVPPGLSVGDEISAIAIDGSNNTSEFGPNFVVTPPLYNIQGTVFEDTAGDILSGAQVIGDPQNPVLGSVTLLLYEDDGGTPGQPDAADTSRGSTTTAGDGTFSFSVPDGTYWVVVDSKTLAADNNLWGEQTYGPLGGWCADGAGGTTQGIGAAGACYGGRRVDPVPANPSSDDLTSWHSGAEHLAQVTIAGGAVSDVDFGFSFNVVTTTRGGDATDDDGANPRWVQGSLRQFIENANAIGGANAMRFVPAEPTNASAGANDWWQIGVSTDLPQITGDATTIDGIAYAFADGVTVRNTNTASIGAGAAVGASGTFNTPQLDPELELRGDTIVNYGLDLRPTADGSEVRHLAINGFSLFAIGIIGFLPDDLDNIVVENNVLGTSPASFTDDPLLSTGRGLFGRDLSNATIRNNLVGWVGWGLQIQFDTFDSLIETNEIRGVDTYGLYLAGVAGTGQQPARNVVRGNLIESSGSIGINTFEVQGEITLTENTVRLTSGHGASIYGAQNTITLNVIKDNSGTGLVLVGNGSPSTASQVFISQNEFGDNGQLAIDLVENGTNPDGPTLNDDLDPDTGANTLINFAVIEQAFIAGPDLIVTGWAPAGSSIEVYLRDTGAPAYGEGSEYLFTGVEGSASDLDGGTGSYGPGPVNGLAQGTESNAQRFEFRVPVGSLPTPVVIGDELVATATVGAGLTRTTSEFGGAAGVGTDLEIVKRAFLPDGTPIPSGETVPEGVEFKYLLYISNPNAARNDVSLQDVLDPAFGYVPGSIRFDNLLPACAADPCTPAEEAAIFAAATAGSPGTDAVDGDTVSYTAAGTTIDAGNEAVANSQLDILGNRVWAIVFSVKMQ